MERYQKPIVVLTLMLIFASWFLHNTKSDFSLIFKKDLLAHDESSNSVVAANVTRKFFPPMVRVNPLVSEQGNWMEGPYWQHIPPMFAYVPYLFFKLDGQVTIEVKRLSYALVVMLTGLLFILSVYKYRKSLLAAASATVAAIFWINTAFTHELITGFAFGASDIVLAFTVVCAFAGVIWYLREEKGERRNYPWWKLLFIAILVALPIIAKNLLGAIPAATFFGLLFWDHRTINKKIAVALSSFIGLLIIYFLPLFFASPETFKNEILVPFLHFKQLEGWGRPWHWYVTNYLPQRYLFGWAWPYYCGLVLAMLYNLRLYVSKKETRPVRVTIAISLLWFLWNLIAISLVTSKVPNFIYQSYLFSLFAIVYSLALPIALLRFPLSREWVPRLTAATLIFALIFTGRSIVRFSNQFQAQRAQAYDYQTEHEKFYQTAEELRSLGLNSNDLIVIHVSDNDCWFRYYVLFLTGSESKTLLEMSFGFDPSQIKQKYKRMYFILNKKDPRGASVLKNYDLYESDLAKLSIEETKQTIQNMIVDHQDAIQKNIIRIKKDKTSCQWLVPDEILNAP